MHCKAFEIKKKERGSGFDPHQWRRRIVANDVNLDTSNGNSFVEGGNTGNESTTENEQGSLDQSAEFYTNTEGRLSPFQFTSNGNKKKMHLLRKKIKR